MGLELKYAGKKVANLRDLIACYPKSQFRSPNRSTVPLLAYWRRPEAAIDEILPGLGCHSAVNVSLDFEHRTPVVQGRGCASSTDLFVRTETTVIAIEAKYTERPAEPVGAWLRMGNRSNRHLVLQGWLGLIGGVAGTTLTAADVGDIPYQMIHRTAAACAQEVQDRHVLYHYFGKDLRRRTHYLAALQSLARCLASLMRLRFWLILSPIEARAPYVQLQECWRAGARDLSEGVKAEVVAGSLMEFQTPEFISGRG